MEDLGLAQEYRLLEQAARRPGLARSVPPVLAAGFGIAPIREEGKTLCVASFCQANPKALALLPRLLGRPVRTIPFDSAPLLRFLQDVYYRKKKGINFHTFQDPDFLDTASGPDAFLTEKTETTGPVVNELPAGRVVFADMDFRATLVNLDAASPGTSRFEASDPKLAFRIVDDCPVVPSETPLPEAKILVLQTSYRSTGWEYRHGVQGEAHERLPVVIHPSEVQITRLGADGTVGLHLYDHIERIAPGQVLDQTITYYFLSHGNRFRRDLRVRVLQVACVDRDKIRYEPEPRCGWSGSDLSRWLGLD